MRRSLYAALFACLFAPLCHADTLTKAETQAQIEATIAANGKKAITGPILQTDLLDMLTITASWQGAWASNVYYSYGEIVTYNGSTWFGDAPVQGVAPGTTDGQWTLFSGTPPGGTPGRLLVDQGAGSLPAFVVMSGDGTLAANGALTLAASGVTAGTYGDGTHVAQVTFDAKGRATAAASVAINIPSSAVSGLGTFATQNYATPPAIGGTTQNSGAFTTLAAQSGTVTGPWYINQGSFTPNVNFPNSTAPLGINESATGTCTTGANNCYFNFLNISSDNAVVGPDSSSPVSGIGFLINHKFGGSAMTGNRIAAAFQATQTATTGNTIDGASYTGLAAYSTALANDNGTGVTSGTASGGIEAFNAIAQLGPSATNFSTVKGAEIDMVMQSGSSAYQKVGFQIAEQFNDAVQGSSGDVAFEIANQSGAVGWNTGIQFGGLLGVWPFKSTGTAITCVSCGTIANFIDMSGATISGYDWKFANATLSGTGTYTGAQMALTEPSTTANNSLSISATSDASGANIKLTGNGATTPSKTIRVISGSLQILNNAYSAGILALSDTGDLSEIRNFTNSGTTTLTALTTAGLVTTTSGGLLGSEAAITSAQCPIATVSATGCLKPDGTTITISGGVISAATGGSGNVTGPGSSVAGDLPTFSDTTGKVLGDSGVPYNAIPAANSTFTAPGTGGVATNVNAILQQHAINPVNYGAKCDGSTDDSAAFQNAITQSESASIPLTFSGTCYIASSLNVTASLSIMGYGTPYSTLKVPAGIAKLFNVTTTARLNFQHFTIQGPATPTAGDTGILVNPATGENSLSYFNDVYINNLWHGYNFKAASQWKIVNSNINVYGGDGVIVANSNNADSGDSTIQGTQILCNDSSGCGGAVYYQSSGGLRFVNSKVNANGGNFTYGVWLALASGANTGVLIIDGDSIENVTDGVYFSRAGTTGTFARVNILGTEFLVTSYGILEPTDANGSWLSGVTASNIVVNLTSATAVNAFNFGTTVAGLQIGPASVVNSGSSSSTKAAITGTQTSSNCAIGPIVGSGTFAASSLGSCTSISPN